ncbi:MAG: hypothetical protein ABIG95_07225 [Candidatus Woesearchaeota archaeon]
MNSLRRTVIALLLYLGLFTLLFFIALYSYTQDVPVVVLGLGAKKTDMLIMALSFIGVIKTTLHIILLK